MIEKTKPYRARGSLPPISEPTQKTSPGVEAPQTENTSDSAPATISAEENIPDSPSRRAWFRSLVPTLGNGLVELLRASNNLKRDLHEATQDKK